MKAIVLILALLGCERSAATPPPAPPSPRVVHEWGDLKFTDVRAFRTNWGTRGLDPIWEGGKLSETRLPKQGIPLDPLNIQRLRHAVTSGVRGILKGCAIDPHHAFVFYDADGEITGALDVCFRCHLAQQTPGDMVETIDWYELDVLIRHLGMPIEDPDW